MKMQYSQNYGSWGIGGVLSPLVKKLILINVSVFVLQWIIGMRFPVLHFFGLVPANLYGQWMIWQPLTYMFLHGSVWHLFFNMLSLWMFGGEIEELWGNRKFLIYYLVCGIGAGLCSSWVQDGVIIGASGAIYGVLVAFAVLFPDRVITLLLFFVFPVNLKAKQFVLIFIAIAFLSAISSSNDHVAHIAHLSGAAIGYLLIRYENRFSSFWKKGSSLSDWSFSDHRSLLSSKDRSSENPETYYQETIDPLLEKISKQGLSSLSKEELRKLEKAKNLKRRIKQQKIVNLDAYNKFDK